MRFHTTKGTCDIGDRACDSAATAGALKEVVTTLCPRCGANACLSCAVTMNVTLPGGRTLGHQRLCHDCAATYPDGLAIVMRHLSLLMGRQVTRVPTVRPVSAAFKGLVESAVAAERAADDKRISGSARAAARKRAADQRRLMQSASLRKNLTKREDGEAPARPRVAPKALMEVLGYARNE